MNSTKITIIIPAYNEEKRIGSTLQTIVAFIKKKKITAQIIVVDDGSTDKTYHVVKSIKGPISILQNAKNHGKGFCVKRGMLSAKYPLVLFSDADLATPIEECEKLIVTLQKGFDVAIASRYLPTSRIQIKQPPLRQVLGKVFPLLVRCFFLPEIIDSQCGFKLFTREAAQKIATKQTLNRFAFDVELLVIAKQVGYKIAQVGVVWNDKKGSTVNPFKDSFHMLADLGKIFFQRLIGKYNH